MSWKDESNVFGGRSLSISAGGDLRTLPPELSRLLTSTDQEAFKKPRQYFQMLANQSELDGPRRFYREIAQSGECTLQIHTAEPVPGSFQSDVLFRVELKRNRSFGFRLPTQHVAEHFPPVLKQLYFSIDGTVEGRVWESGGLERAESVGLNITDYGIDEGVAFAAPDGGIDSFYKTSAGDLLFAYKDKAVWFLHENCSFEEAGQLTDVIDRYFTSLLDNVIWLPSPY